MEHQALPGYITEKIALAFLSGSIPIYYGDKHTVDRLYNKDAFIFFDIHHEKAALNWIAYLESNLTAWQEMRSKPVFTEAI